MASLSNLNLIKINREGYFKAEFQVDSLAVGTVSEIYELPLGFPDGEIISGIIKSDSDDLYFYVFEEEQDLRDTVKNLLKVRVDGIFGFNTRAFFNVDKSKSIYIMLENKGSVNSGVINVRLIILKR